jgi:hypothetical protein
LLIVPRLSALRYRPSPEQKHLRTVEKAAGLPAAFFVRTKKCRFTPNSASHPAYIFNPSEPAA